ncbi:MAG TPA: hypothetical protein VLW50_28140 [Streptosporangiaceae bacterium]|nr:hypothetical protein [Streptosporangiaceae bacterium]
MRPRRNHFDLIFDLDITEPYPEQARLLKAVRESTVTSAPTPGGSQLRGTPPRG